MKSLFFFLLSTLLVSTTPLLDYEIFPTRYEFPNLPVCINETIFKKSIVPEVDLYVPRFTERLALGNETCLPASETCRPALEDCCGFYDCLERNCACGAGGYPLGYGKKYCQLFSNYPFTGNGDRWRDATLRCLQRSLIPFSQCPPTTCDTMKTKAFDSHPFCYTSSGVCFLSPKDLLGIISITYGDVLTMDGVIQILETIKKCGLRYMLQFEIEIVSKACQLKEGLRKILTDLWRRNQFLPEWILSTSVWEFKEKRGDNEVWKLKVSLFHTDDSILPEQRNKDLISVAGTLVDFTNSEEYKNELQNSTLGNLLSVKATVDSPLVNNVSSNTFSSLILLFVFYILLF